MNDGKTKEEYHFKSPHVSFSVIEDKKFYKNGVELQGEDGKEYSISQFKGEIQKEINKILNQKYNNIVVLAGAGASVVSDSSGNTKDEYGRTVASIGKHVDEVLKKESDSDKDDQIYYSLELVPCQ